MIIIIEYLHQNKIMFRDIRPESFMIDHEVYFFNFY